MLLFINIFLFFLSGPYIFFASWFSVFFILFPFIFFTNRSSDIFFPFLFNFFLGTIVWDKDFNLIKKLFIILKKLGFSLLLHYSYPLFLFLFLKKVIYLLIFSSFDWIIFVVFFSFNFTLIFCWFWIGHLNLFLFPLYVVIIVSNRHL